MEKKVIVALLTGVTLLIYVSGVVYFKDRFLPRTIINNEKVFGQDVNKINLELSKDDKWEQLEIIVGDDKLFSIRKKDINYEYVDSAELTKIKSNQNNWLWFIEMFKKEDYYVEPVFTFEKEKIKSIVKSYKPLYTELINADLVYSEKNKQFEITPHAYLIDLTENLMCDKITAKIEAKEKNINLNNYTVYPKKLDTDEELINLKNKVNKYLDVVINYDFSDNIEVVDRNKIKDWIVINGQDITFNEELIREYIISLSDKYDTYGKSREFKTFVGNVINTKGGSYGWLIHRGNTVKDLIDNLLTMENKTIEPVYSYMAIKRDTNDIGNSYIEIDIQNQMVYVYEKGELMVSTPTITGNVSKGYDTPLGVYPINYKTKNAILRGPGYAAPVDYWMPFNGGVGLHDANWQSSFGGEIYKRNGSHGCINLPPKVSGEIFNLVFPGMPVIVY